MPVVLITGCSSGFGKLAAIAFAKRGDRVFATMRNLDGAGPLQDAAASAAVDIEILQLDVRDPGSVEAAVAEAINRAGRIDILVNNAGVGAVAAVEDFDDDELLRVFDTNVFGPVRVARAVLPHMRRQRSGRIINIGSLSGVVSTQFRGIYSATKAALSSISEALFFELHPWNIHVSNIEPGFFDTEIGDKRLPTRRQGTSDYAPLLEQYEKGSTPGGSQRAEPTPVIDAIIRAATEDSPRRHYLVGKDAEALGAMRTSMPDEKLAEIILRSMPSLESASPS